MRGKGNRVIRRGFEVPLTFTEEETIQSVEMSVLSKTVGALLGQVNVPFTSLAQRDDLVVDRSL